MPKMRSAAWRGWVVILGSPLQPPVELCSRTDDSPSTVAAQKSNIDQQLIFYRPTGWPLGSIGTSQHKGDKALYTTINHPNQPAENPCADGVSLHFFLNFIFPLVKGVLSRHQRPYGRYHEGRSLWEGWSCKQSAHTTQTSHRQMTQATSLVQVLVCDLFLGYRSSVWEECAMSSDREEGNRSES